MQVLGIASSTRAFGKRRCEACHLNARPIPGPIAAPTRAPASPPNSLLACVQGIKSPMALIWVIEWGCLSAADAEKHYPDYLKVKGKAA